jgi:hypothetical protein
VITIFTIPKPFTGLSDIIQRNAILSWQRLHGDSQILIFGDDPSVVKFAKDHNIQCISDFKSNNYGTPLLDGIWRAAHDNAENEYICYINTDIILFPDFVEKTTDVNLDSFFLAGRRWDVKIDFLLEFDSDWILQCKELVHEKGVLHRDSGVDYFLFPKKCMPDMPPFAIGRGWWDNWLLFNFIKRSIPLIDGTEIMTIHQNHDYSHIKSATKNTTHKGIERENNGTIANLKYWQLFYITDSEYILQTGKIIKRPFRQLLNRIIYRYITQSLGIIRNKLGSIKTIMTNIK